MSSWLDRVSVVLCRPEGGLNIGACCRAMKSMGLSRLTLVAPGEFEDDEVFRMAIHARELYEGARRCGSLQSALAGTVLSAGITRRRGVKRKWFSVLPEELADRAASAASGVTAIVFGNERTGLSDDELNQCTMACHIPASPEFPSLNLSHAVQIISSAFWRRFIGEETGGYNPITREKVDHLAGVVHSSLAAMNYFKSADRFHTERFFRDIFTRAALSAKEARHLEKIFRKLQYLKAQAAGDSEDGPPQ